MVNQRQLNNGQQGSGSGLDADTTDGKQASELGADADGKTVRINNNGKIEDIQKSQLLTFENDSEGFTKFVSSGDQPRDNKRGTNSQDSLISAHSGSYAWLLNSGYGEITDFGIRKDVDLTGLESVEIWIRPAPGSSSHQISVTLGSNTIYSKSGDNIPSETYQKLTYDVSNLSGTKALEFLIQDDTDAGGIRMNIDDIKLIEPENVEVLI